MTMRFRRFFSEPLLHFLVIGAALFVFYDLTREQGSDAPNRIVVSSGQVEQLAANFERARMREPTESELAGLVENHVREEVFYREALAMGLDQNDPLVRQRMRLKLEFILEDLSAEAVSDEQLAAFLKEQSDQFRRQPQISFEQVYLNPDKHTDPDAAAKTMLDRLNDGVAPESLGDSTLLPYAYTLARQDEIERAMGKQFAREVAGLVPGDDWVGPVYSEFGAHLLQVSDRVDARLPELAEIRAEVERDYLSQRRDELKSLVYEKLRAGYEVTIESAERGQGTGGDLATAAETDNAKQ
jgi:hypothetical protein